MRNRPAALLTIAVLAVLLREQATAADDATLSRAKEMLHRTQEALRTAQAQNADLARSKTELEQKLQAATQQVDAAKSSTKTAQSALGAKLGALQNTQAETQRKYTETADRLTETKAKLADIAHQLALRDADVADVKHSLEQSIAAGAVCEKKNLALYGYAEAVLQKYKEKGVWSALSQKEPVLGLKNVAIENAVQEYQLKFDGQKVTK